ncbi:MAG: ribonuclease HI [Bacteriovoracaceae bacterium]|jgi:ribonuclease HI|nr:ribonuclease HI [Bacteriovoracaceae bacterium]
MKRKDAQKMISRLKDAFKSDNEAMNALEILSSKALLLEESSSVSVDNMSDFPIPQELVDLSEGTALFSDGACRGNPGPGAWGILVQNARGDIVLKSSGVELKTTNNRMELSGVLQGLNEILSLEGIDRHRPVFVYSDSKYVVDGMKSWVKNWKERGWKKADNKEPENVDLWKGLDEVAQKFSSLYFIWVKGHAGHPQNEYCDKMCNQALDESGI